MGEIIMNVCDLTKYYGSGEAQTCAVDHISFCVAQGDFLGIMGPSGSGKTTLLNLLATIDSASGGSVYYGKEDITKLKEEQLADFRRDKLGFVFQDFNLLDTLTVRENIILALSLRGCHGHDAEACTEQIMKLLDISAERDKFPYQISGGQRQRCACARAIVNKPQLLLADEPTGALDSKASNTLMESFRKLNENEKATILMVTHDAFCASWCKRILFMNDGKFSEELKRGNKGQREFFNEILDVQIKAGGGLKDAH